MTQHWRNCQLGGSPTEVNAKEGRKVLTINWDTEHDIFSFNFEKLSNSSAA